MNNVNTNNKYSMKMNMNKLQREIYRIEMEKIKQFNCIYFEFIDLLIQLYPANIKLKIAKQSCKIFVRLNKNKIKSTWKYYAERYIQLFEGKDCTQDKLDCIIGYDYNNDVELKKYMWLFGDVIHMLDVLNNETDDIKEKIIKYIDMLNQLSIK
jgi:hypothetical protein